MVVSFSEVCILLGADASPEQRLQHRTWEHWKSYFKELGEVLGAVHDRMSREGVAPERIVLGGGIAEACREFLPRSLKKFALELIHEAGHLKAGTVWFSTLSPEAREAAFSQSRTARVYDYWEVKNDWQSYDTAAYSSDFLPATSREMS